MLVDLLPEFSLLLLFACFFEISELNSSTDVSQGACQLYFHFLQLQKILHVSTKVP